MGAALMVMLAIAPSVARAGETSLGSCSWRFRSDPVLVNALAPDEDGIYYSANLPAPPPGIQYRIRGEFPHARYMSFVSYDALPIDALLDVDITPDAGNVNTFEPGALRIATSRSYTVRLIAEPPPSDVTAREPGALYVGGGELQSPKPTIRLLYRIYVPDKGTGILGGVPLPWIEVLGADPSLDLSAVPCERVRDDLGNSPLRDLNDRYAGTSGAASAPASVTSEDPPNWSVRSGLGSSTRARLGQDDRSGGPASNPHNRYISANVSRAFGEVLAIRGKAPTAPRTFLGEHVMGTGDLRYWSFCQNSLTTRFIDCLSDTHIEVDSNGYYTIAISDPTHRPASARNWLAFGPEPEGLVLYRHMLPSPEFHPYSAQAVEAGDVPIEATMLQYFPRAAYCSAAEFDRDECGLIESEH